jgi:hypothetical protein
MRIKILIVAALLLLTAVTGAYSFGIGAQFNLNASSVFTPGIALALSPGETTHLAFNWLFGDDNMIGLTADVCPLNLALSSFEGGGFYFTLGGGLYANLLLSQDNVDFNGGIRFPIGLSLKMAENVFEIYAHGAPSIGLRFYPSLRGDSFFLPSAVGVRFWVR